MRNGFDVFMDVTHLSSGDFDVNVLREIEERAHFITVLQPATRFDQAYDGVDWMRREIGHALSLERNVIPVMADGFAFSQDNPLPIELSKLATANGVVVYPDYFDEAMHRLCTRFLGSGNRRRQESGKGGEPSVRAEEYLAATRQLEAELSERIERDPEILVDILEHRESDGVLGETIVPPLLRAAFGKDRTQEIMERLRIDPGCRLNALGSRQLAALRGELDLSRFRFVAAQPVAARLDRGTVLMQLTPGEFEHLVRELFEARGMASWVTQASRDEGVDAVAYDPDALVGGLCVIQAKRYTSVIGADAVRALWGTMEDKKASTGVLVTTSYFGRSAHEFAQRNQRVRLMDGPQLTQQLHDYLGLDVVTGAKAPPGSR